MTTSYIRDFQSRIEQLPREEILEIIEGQNPEIIPQINRIEWVFANKLRHLKWQDGTPITGRPLTNQELSLLVDPPFKLQKELTEMGLDKAKQMEVHLASDVVLWARQYLKTSPRAYQILMMRDPSLRSVFRLGRRAGKTYTLAVRLLHYSYTTVHGRSLVMAPMKSQVSLLFDEVMKLAKQGGIDEYISRSVMSPQHEIHFTNGSTLRFFTTGMKSGGRCLTPDHDVLTESGWKPIADVQAGEIVASWKDGELLWSKAAASWSYEYVGPMLQHSSPGLNFMATPNHKWKVLTRGSTSRRTRGNAYWLDSTELKSDLRIPATVNPVQNTLETYSPEEMELWGWWLGDGAGYIGKMVRISQVKERGRKRLVELAECLGLHYTTPSREIRIEWKPPVYSGEKVYDKFIPERLFKEKNLHSLLDGLIGSDGWQRKNGWEYYSSSDQLADDVQRLGFLCGYRVAKKRKYAPPHTYTPDGVPSHVIRQTKAHWKISAYPYVSWTTSRTSMKWVDYEGPVHCITVPETGTFIARHKGSVFVTGNSDVARGQEAHMIVLDEMDYMGIDDLDALYAMLQRTDEDQPDKIMIGASTPTGRKERFYQWASGLSPDGSKMPEELRFKEFWFPSFVSMLWDAKTEKEMRNQYTDIVFRHEIEADWGEDSEGVYPRRYVDAAFLSPDWKYVDEARSARSDYLIGVDWDKFGAGPNIVVLEVCGEDYQEERFAGKIRVAYRQEIPRHDYVLTEAVDRVIELNSRFRPKYIYVDMGFGATQVELLQKYGVEHPESGLRDSVKGVSFGGMREVKDPITKHTNKKDTKPYMVDTLRGLLEQGNIVFPESDEELYMQLISYVVTRVSSTGRPVFGSSGSQVDHAHDALILACLAYIENYGELNKLLIARRARSISRSFIMPEMLTEKDEKVNSTIATVSLENPDSDDEGVSDYTRMKRRNLGARRVSYNRTLTRNRI